MKKNKDLKKTSVLGALKKQLNILLKENHKKVFVVFFLAFIFGGSLPVVLTYLPKYIISLVVESSSTKDIIITVSIFVGILSICQLIKSIGDSFDEMYFMRVRFNEFNKMSQKLQEIDYKYLEDSKFMDEMKVAETALNGNQMGFEGFYHNLYKIIVSLSTIIIFSVIISLFQPLILVSIVISSIVIILLNNAISKYIDSVKEKRGHAIRQTWHFFQVCYDFTYGKDIRLYNLKDPIIDDYKKKSYSYLSVVKKIYNKQFALSLFELLMLLIQDGVAYFLIIYSYYTHQIDIGDVTLYLLATISLSQTIRTLLENLREANTNLGYSTTYFDYIENNSFYSKTGTHKRFDYGVQLEIEFKNVSFQYNNTNSKVLDNVSFKINAGEKIAIVGINGAGKSTIVKLISGLLYPDSGEILINGINVNDFDNQEYSLMFSTVFQDVVIYATSIYENIGGENFDKDKVIECVEKVGLKDKVESLALKYDTPLLKVIESDGIELSGGENQKLSIARALYKRANCIVLDEPTSALDALTEASIYQSFNELVSESTSIYISHRLSSTKFCDRILLFNKSGLVEEGTHDSLMELKGDYYNMFVVQGKYYQEESENND